MRGEICSELPCFYWWLCKGQSYMTNLKRRCEYMCVSMTICVSAHLCITCLWEVAMPAIGGPSGRTSTSSLASGYNDVSKTVLLCMPHITGSWAAGAAPTLCKWGMMGPKDGCAQDTRSAPPPLKLTNDREARDSAMGPWPLATLPSPMTSVRQKTRAGSSSLSQGIAPWWDFPSPWVTAVFVCLGWSWSRILLLVLPLTCVRCPCSLCYRQLSPPQLLSACQR